MLKSRQEHIVDCARPYLASRVGGHGLETVGTTVDFAHQGYDGVIQIGPLTCMPEIVAQSILLRVAKEEQIPCMTLYFDEHSANAGITTRLRPSPICSGAAKRLALMAAVYSEEEAKVHYYLGLISAR